MALTTLMFCCTNLILALPLILTVSLASSKALSLSASRHDGEGDVVADTGFTPSTFMYHNHVPDKNNVQRPNENAFPARKLNLKESALVDLPSMEKTSTIADIANSSQPTNNIEIEKKEENIIDKIPRYTDPQLFQGHTHTESHHHYPLYNKDQRNHYHHQQYPINSQQGYHHVNEIPEHYHYPQGPVPYNNPKDEPYTFEEPIYGHKALPKPEVDNEHIYLGSPLKTGEKVRDSFSNSFIGPAFSRALQFWLPSALLLTGASVLFPKRIHVPTEEQPLNVNYRPKREAHFRQLAHEIDSHFLSQEHRTELDNENESEEAVRQNYQSESFRYPPKYPVYRVSYSGSSTAQNGTLIPTIPKFSPIPDSRLSNPGSLVVTKQSENQQLSPKQKFTQSGKRVIIVVRTKSKNQIHRPAEDNVEQLVPNSSEQNTVTTLIAPKETTPLKFPTNAANSSSKEIINEINDNEAQNKALVLKNALNSLQKQSHPKEYDLSSNGPVYGLLNSVMQYEHESEDCQKRALCELAIRGTNPTATRFETFMWSLATLVPDAFTYLYDLDDVFKAIRGKSCTSFICDKPNLNIQA